MNCQLPESDKSMGGTEDEPPPRPQAESTMMAASSNSQSPFAYGARNRGGINSRLAPLNVQVLIVLLLINASMITDLLKT